MSGSRKKGRAYGQEFGLTVRPVIGRPVAAEEAQTPIYGEGRNHRERRALAAIRRKAEKRNKS